MTFANWIHPLLFAGAAEWTPPDIENCVLWLDANQIAGFGDGDPLGVWQDESGLANDAAEGANPPTYLVNIQNGLPIVRFDGVDRLTVPNFATNNFVAITQMTSFVVYNPRGDAGYNVLNVGGAGQHWRFAGDGGFYNSYFRNARTVNNPPNQPNDAHFHLHTLRSGPTNTYVVRRDGVLASTYAQAWGVALADLVIANAGDAGGMAGDIAEIIVYARELTDDEVTVVESYLVAKWAGPYYGYGIYDTFTDINGTNLNVHVPEKGSWTEVDTGGLCDIQSNKAQITGAGVYTDPLFYAGPFDRATGREFVFTIKPGQLNQQMAIALWSGLNFDPVTGDKEHLMWFFSDGNIYCREAVEPAAGAYTTDERECRIVLKAVGAEYWYNGIMIADLAVNNGSPLYVGVAAKGGTWDFDFMSFG